MNTHLYAVSIYQVLCHRWWAQDCDGWPLAHRELIHSLTGLRSYAKLKFFRLVTKGSSPTNDRMKGGWTLSENKNKTRYGRTKLGKVWRGWGFESRRMKKQQQQKKNTKENILWKKSFTASILEKNYYCLDLPKYFTEILATRTREQIVVKNFRSLKQAFCAERIFSIQNNILTINFFIYLIPSPR